ncbi:MAG: helix-turn-helix domain-containing protein [Prevotella sp.]|nr:helix-turn-helix domain-containing protein [Prevotella sp.]
MPLIARHLTRIVGMLCVLFLAACSSGGGSDSMDDYPLPHSTPSDTTACPWVKIEAERLPDLNIARSGHAVFCVNGEPTVVGGHTTNFLPTATAEYYEDGKWHLVETAFPHDIGICVVLSSGKVILGGGSEKPLGIGQTYPVEEYDPTTHTFRAFSCFDTKRTLAQAIEIDSGRVVVAGNWYAGDSIELFDGDRYFHFAKEVTVGRASPYMLRTSSGDVLILGNGGTHGEPLMSDVADRLKGEPLHVPLLRRWQPLFYEAPFCNNTGFIGDEATGNYSWLMPVEDWQEGDSTTWEPYRQLAFLLVRDTTFALLPTTCPVPKKGPYGEIQYISPVIADRKVHRGYVHGIDKDNRHYIVSVEYNKRPAPLTLYYTDPLPDAGFPHILLTDEGDLMITGGINYNRTLGGTLGNDNYSPLASVYLLHVSSQSQDQAEGTKSAWLWMTLTVILLTAAALLIIFWRKRKPTERNDVEVAPIIEVANVEEEADENEKANAGWGTELMSRISQLMEHEQLFLDSDLKLTDLATRLNTNRNVVSACINTQLGCSFSQFISNYRVEHAKQLLRQHPDIKMAEVWMQSGFTTESSFFRAFKATTGKTPSEWKAEND